MLSIDIPFIQNELECPCGCGQAIRQPDLIKKLVTARWHAQTPFIVTSWNRCPNHNEEIGGIEDSEHLKGYAVDILARESQEKFQIMSAVIYAGFKRIGIYPWGFHLGANPAKPQNVIWIGGEKDD